jgi:hypothetical protein
MTVEIDYLGPASAAGPGERRRLAAARAPLIDYANYQTAADQLVAAANWPMSSAHLLD